MENKQKPGCLICVGLILIMIDWTLLLWLDSMLLTFFGICMICSGCVQSSQMKKQGTTYQPSTQPSQQPQPYQQPQSSLGSQGIVSPTTPPTSAEETTKAKYCPHCGAPTEGAKFCSVCGGEIED